MYIRFVENNFAFSAVRKKHKDAFLFSYFSVTKSTKSHLRGFSILLKIFFRRLAATSANKVPRPSDYSLTMATGSKRPRADSDSLLCHVGLWRTSRFRFGCASVCEHSEIGFVSAIYCNNTSSVAVNRATFSHWRRLIVTPVSALAKPTPATHFSAGVQAMRARICSTLSCDMFARVV